jgi:hypothetical protein
MFPYCPSDCEQVLLQLSIIFIPYERRPAEQSKDKGTYLVRVSTVLGRDGEVFLSCLWARGRLRVGIRQAH